MGRAAVVTLKSEHELSRIRVACGIVADALEAVRTLAKPGVTTAYLDKEAEKRIIESGARPAFKGYGGTRKRPPFPATICTSLNEQVVHGIPDDRPLREGDLLSVDCGACYEGYYGDGAITVGIGEISEEATRLMTVCREALEMAIAKLRPGVALSEVSRTIQSHVEGNGFAVVRELVGHGIGSSLWEEPQVPNYVGPTTKDLVLKAGMVLAIEPMITAGDWRVRTLANRWTVVSRDGSLAAHFEHSVAITRDGREVLTVVENSPRSRGPNG